MNCDQCGKENREGSKFCRHCGANISATSSATKSPIQKISLKISWKNPIVIILISLLLLGGLSFGGYKAYAYYQVQSKIIGAKKLQSTGDFNGSISALSNLGGYTPTTGQQSNINTIKADDQKFLTFKASFDAAVALESSSSSSDLQTALKDLQSIDPSYPVYKNVQSEITKVQSSLVTTLQGDADASKKAATAAATAQARAEANAQEAQNEAETAKVNGEQAATQALKTAFINQLQSAFDDFHTIAMADFDTAISDTNNSDYSVALVWFAKSNEASRSTSQTCDDIYSNFTNIPDSYSTALADLQNAATDLISANNSGLNDSDTNDTSAATNQYSTEATTYLNEVKSFLANPQ